MSGFESMQAEPAPEVESAPEAQQDDGGQADAAPDGSAEQPSGGGESPPEATPDPEPATEQPQRMVPLAAKQDEVRKRQDLEVQNARLQAQLEMFQQQQQAQPQPEAKSQEDLDLEFLESPTQAVQRLLAQEREQLQQEFNNRLMAQSEARAAATHEDFGEMRAAFIEQTKAQPSLIDEMWRAPDPAEFAYQWAKQYSQFQRAGSVDSLVKEAEERGRAAAIADLEKKYAVQSAQSNTPTTAGARAAGQPPPAEYPSEINFGNGY